ncbi:MAG: hypothetical protein ACFFAS_21125 [Promethearchaeota archaeon]
MINVELEIQQNSFHVLKSLSSAPHWEQKTPIVIKLPQNGQYIFPGAGKAVGCSIIRGICGCGAYCTWLGIGRIGRKNLDCLHRGHLLEVFNA